MHARCIILWGHDQPISICHTSVELLIQVPGEHWEVCLGLYDKAVRDIIGKRSRAL